MTLTLIRPAKKQMASYAFWAPMHGDSWAVYWEGADDNQPGTASIRDVDTGEVLSEFFGPTLWQARACAKFGIWWDLQAWPGQFGIPEDGVVTYAVAAE